MIIDGAMIVGIAVYSPGGVLGLLQGLRQRKPAAALGGSGGGE
jgi:hypothetical protein